ncbi:MAG: hypothetical protein R3D52_09150 [Xanthobacteraceae bacterium]
MTNRAGTIIAKRSPPETQTDAFADEIVAELCINASATTRPSSTAGRPGG